ncbi:MAG: epoxyqueuosine reductase QueH [Candidatus Cloacimonetes bacterium]|nr:epoxyqueuosine reductase QueH [Candidatus Cloacimonadota bacterium]
MEKEKLLVHICCAPCFIAPYEHLKAENRFDLRGFWFNSNIHPYQEYSKRRDTLQEFTEKQSIPMIWKDEYLLEEFLRKVSYREGERCRICYYERLRYAAIIAAKGNFDYFTTTLLYSKFQKHELIRETGEALGKEMGVKFYYQDFREYWKEGIERSKAANMYRQQYCGCIFSEKERFQEKEPKKDLR